MGTKKCEQDLLVEARIALLEAIIEETKLPRGDRTQERATVGGNKEVTVYRQGREVEPLARSYVQLSGLDRRY